MLPQRSDSSIAKEVFFADKKTMHAKHADSEWLNGLSGRVIGCRFTELNTLGAGSLECVYENTWAFEIRERACPGAGQSSIGRAAANRQCALYWRGGQ